MKSVPRSGAPARDKADVSKRLLEKNALGSSTAASEKKNGGGDEEFADPAGQPPENVELGIAPAVLSSTPHMIRMRSRPGSFLAAWPRSLMRLQFMPRSWRIEQHHHANTMYPSRPRSMISGVGEDRPDATADSLAEGVLGSLIVCRSGILVCAGF